MTLIDKAEAMAVVNGYWQSIGGGLPEGPSDEAILGAVDAIAERLAALPARGVRVKPDAAEMLAKEMQAIVAADRWKGRDLSAAPPEKWSHLRPETQQFWIDTASRILSALAPTDAAQATAPFFFDRYINGVQMAEGVCIERETTLEGAMQAAARIAAKGPNGEAPVLVYRARAALTTEKPYE